MVQPYDYRLNVPNPVEEVLRGLMIGQQFRQQQAQQQRQEQLKTAVRDLQANPTSEKFANLYLIAPELKENLDAYRASLSEGDKTTLTSAAREALLAQRAGKSEEVATIFERYATAAENSNRPEMAKQFRDAQTFVTKYPGQAETTIKMFYQGVDPDGFTALNADAETLDKDYALNVRLFGREKADQLRYAGEAAKGILQITGPAGTTYKRADEVNPLTPVAAAAVATGGAPPSAEHTMTVDQWKMIEQSTGQKETAEWARRHGLTVRVNSPDEARGLPSGTKILLPDGRIGTVP